MSALEKDVIQAFDFKDPDYEQIFAKRVESIQRIQANPDEALPSLEAYYKDNPADWINDWGLTFDPRNAEIGLPIVVPFLLFPKQREFIEWLHHHWMDREDGLVEKSRDMGISWLCMAFSVWMWRFYPNSVVGVGSRKEEYVDRVGDPKSLFWKARQYVNLLPPFWKPHGWNYSKHAPFMRIMNKQNGATILGEAGDNIGRGNRTSIYFVDEAAFLEHGDSIQAALSQTTNCRIEASTPNSSGDAFARRRFSGKVDVFTFHWQDDPRKDQDWYDDQCRRHDEEVVAREIDINYEGSTTDTWFPGKLVDAAMRNGPADVEAIGSWIVGVDAAHFGDDVSVIHKRKGRLNLPQVCRKKLDGHQLASLVEGECTDLEAGGDRVHEIIIELDGPGVSCYDTLRKGKYANIVRGVHTGQTGDSVNSVNPSRLKDGRNYNLRAKMHREAKEYLEDVPVSLPNDRELKAQMCAIKYSHKDGQLLMQKKSEYKKENGKSPDKSDAFMLTFASGTNPKSRKPDPRRSSPRALV